MPTREDAWDLLCEWTQSDSLRKDEHCAFVIAALREIQEELGLRRTEAS